MKLASAARTTLWATAVVLILVYWILLRVSAPLPDEFFSPAPKGYPPIIITNAPGRVTPWVRPSMSHESQSRGERTHRIEKSRVGDVLDINGDGRVNTIFGPKFCVLFRLVRHFSQPGRITRYVPSLVTTTF